MGPSALAESRAEGVVLWPNPSDAGSSLAAPGVSATGPSVLHPACAGFPAMHLKRRPGDQELDRGLRTLRIKLVGIMGH